MPDSDLFISLTPARKPGRLLWVRRAAIIAIERDPDPDQIPHNVRSSHPNMVHENNSSTLVRLSGSDYVHLVEELPDKILAKLEAQTR